MPTSTIFIVYVFCHFADGDIKGPECFSGPLGRQFSGKYGLTRTNMNMSFKPIDGKVVQIEEDCEEILQNQDMKQLHDLSLLVQFVH